MPHLAIGAPAQIAVTGSDEIHLGDVLEAARRIEARGHFAGEGLVMDETAARAERIACSYSRSASSSRPSIRATSAPTSAARLAKFSGQWSRPGVELLQVFRQPRAMIFAVLRRGGIMDCRMAKRIVEVVLNDLQKRHGTPEHRLRPGGRLQGVHVFTREETRLQLADVVPTFRERQRRVASQIALKITFTEHTRRRRSQDG